MILNFVTRYGATLSTLLILSASSIIFIRLTFLFGEIFLLISTTEKMFTVQDLSVRIGKIADSTLYLRQVGETWIHSRIASEGLPIHSVIAVSGMGNRRSVDAFNRWCYGLRRLEEAKAPILIIVYGEHVDIQGLHTPLKFVPCFIQERLRKL